MTTITETTVQVYQMFIKATPEQIWEAITKPEFTAKYFYGARIECTAERMLALSPEGETWNDSAVAEWDPPHRLVYEWRSLYDPELAAEEPSRVAWEIEANEGGFSKLTVVHDQLEGAPKTAASGSPVSSSVFSPLSTIIQPAPPTLAG